MGLLLAFLISRPLKYSRICNTRVWRRIYFYVVDQTSFLVSNGTEKFILSASDQGIGKSVFIEQQPFDFYKMNQVIALLGGRHKRLMLIDVGANVGTICIPAVKRGLFRQAVAVEPAPGNYAMLSANIWINDLAGQIIAYNVALGKHDSETLNFELSMDNLGDHRITLSGEARGSARKVISVKSETLDKIIPYVEPDTALLWIDTQGFEGYVLAGASNALRCQIPIVLEFWPQGMSRTESYQLLKKALTTAGYKHFYDLERSMKPVLLSNQSLDEVYDFYDKLSVEGGGYTDLLIV